MTKKFGGRIDFDDLGSQNDCRLLRQWQQKQQQQHMQSYRATCKYTKYEQVHLSNKYEMNWEGGLQ